MAVTNFTPSLSKLPQIHQCLPIPSLCWLFHCERWVFYSGALSVLFPVMWVKVGSLGEESLAIICNSRVFELLKAVFLFFNGDCIAKRL
ncbi:hypothetical protein AMTRI_Chr13g83100 [Amborella trichopoda]